MLWSEKEPFGRQADYLGHAITASTIANINRDPKKRAKPFELQDFIPNFGEQEREAKTAEELYGMIRTWVSMAGK